MFPIAQEPGQIVCAGQNLAENLCGPVLAIHSVDLGGVLPQLLGCMEPMEFLLPKFRRADLVLFRLLGGKFSELTITLLFLRWSGLAILLSLLVLRLFFSFFQ